MNGRLVAFQNSYGRAAAAVALWCVAGLLPVLITSVRVPTVKNVSGLAFVSMYAIYGLVQLQQAIRKRQWSDIIIFGAVPTALFVACAIALSRET
jgi:thiamine monophosphate kinase